MPLLSMMVVALLLREPRVGAAGSTDNHSSLLLIASVPEPQSHTQRVLGRRPYAWYEQQGLAPKGNKMETNLSVHELDPVADILVAPTASRPHPVHGPIADLLPEGFPDRLGQRFRTAAGAGDERRVRRVIRAARNGGLPFKNRTLVIAVVGGSPQLGSGCTRNAVEVISGPEFVHKRHRIWPWWNVSGAPGVAESGRLVAVGNLDFVACSWSGRLSRYLLAAHPELNFLVVNLAVPGSNTLGVLNNMRNMFSKVRFNGYRSSVTLPRPLASLVNLVLIDTSANDEGTHPDPVNLAISEAFFRCVAALPSSPVVTYLDTPAQARMPLRQHALDLKIAQAYDLSVIDMGEDDLSIAKALPQLFGPDYVPGDYLWPPNNYTEAIRWPLKNIYVGAEGPHHYNAPYHEWVAAVLYYSYFSPLFEDEVGVLAAARVAPSSESLAVNASSKSRLSTSRPPRGPLFFLDCHPPQNPFDMALCRVANGTQHIADFDMESKYVDNWPVGTARDARGTIQAGGWVHGADVANKYGWLACHNWPSSSGPTQTSAVAAAEPLPELTFILYDCGGSSTEVPEVVVGYLRSYDPRMGSVNVSVRQFTTLEAGHYHRSDLDRPPIAAGGAVIDSFSLHPRTSVSYSHYIPLRPTAHPYHRPATTSAGEPTFLQVVVTLLAPPAVSPGSALHIDNATNVNACASCVPCDVGEKSKFKLQLLGCI